ncbi:hypothetical protein SCLCIDRAFT_1075789 [Scleroderma citrinum Foug A]|uniref:Uncharacterized protein n=1 Tax=Scleroderma citrinum Foug A TaxID=1036808 RepID=A0A0C3E513_9AGAM|nr:hypothetical protein SCLCIDRAFT_1075789 [Scleroderma citrinum Foug A]
MTNDILGLPPDPYRCSWIEHSPTLIHCYPPVDFVSLALCSCYVFPPYHFIHITHHETTQNIQKTTSQKHFALYPFRPFTYRSFHTGDPPVLPSG